MSKFDQLLGSALDHLGLGSTPRESHHRPSSLPAGSGYRALFLAFLAAACTTDTQIHTDTDEDGDGYTKGTDCNDNNPTIYPNAVEICDEVDNNCDGTIDEPDASNAATFFADTDGDGYGNPGSSVLSCLMPNGYQSNNSDCNDTNYAVHPEATEYCDGFDNDCDGATDEDDAEDVSTWYEDQDGDGFGNALESTTACYQPTGYTSEKRDCDDLSMVINPGVPESCDGTDNDCDGVVDENDAVDAPTWFQDSDGDGYGNSSETTTACDMPGGYGTDYTDCDDEKYGVHPGATEFCDGLDNDCNGLIDELGAVDALTWYEDMDGDGYGSLLVTTSACTAPTGYIAITGDCDDSNANVNFDATEVCNEIDDDCNGQTDEGTATPPIWYQDLDGDGYGNYSAPLASCTTPIGYVENHDDCDDNDPAISPEAEETWYDGIDQDCDDGSDYDADLDGHDSSEYEGGDDCDDTNATVNPDATEICDDGLDNDCNNDTDTSDMECCPYTGTWYPNMVNIDPDLCVGILASSGDFYASTGIEAYTSDIIRDGDNISVSLSFTPEGETTLLGGTCLEEIVNNGVMVASYLTYWEETGTYSDNVCEKYATPFEGVYTSTFSDELLTFEGSDPVGINHETNTVTYSFALPAWATDYETITIATIAVGSTCEIPLEFGGLYAYTTSLVIPGASSYNHMEYSCGNTYSE